MSAQISLPGKQLLEARLLSSERGEPASSVQNESTPFAPVGAYGITKTTGIHCCRLYRNGAGVHASTGILYNHESPLRRPGFVSQKIVRGAVDIRKGRDSKLVLGDLSAVNDWGWAEDTVEAMVRIVRSDEPDDFVVATGEAHTVADFVEEFPAVSRGRRVVIYVSGEASFVPGIKELISPLSHFLRAPVVWSVNGANAVSPTDPWGYGYISFGGNDAAMKLWRSVGPDDVVIALGFDPGEYSLNLGRINAGWLYHFTDLRDPYGHKHGEFRHRAAGEVQGGVDLGDCQLLPRLGEQRQEPDTGPLVRGD